MEGFHIKLRRTNVPDDELLEDLRRVARDLRKETLSWALYNERGEFSSTNVSLRFGSWNKALIKAGLAISHRMDITDEELFQNLAEVWTSLGSQPRRRQMDGRQSGTKFVSRTYETRFGTWNNALVAFSKYISETNNAEVDKPSSAPQGSDPMQIRNRRTSRDINWRLRAKILIGNSCICQMCGDSPAKNPDTILHVDHILAWANGGETVEENLQTLCAKCNIGKSAELLPGQSKPNHETLAFPANPE